ncbi:efflux RND transporter periplasmic adaptor subunit [Parvularcula sp. IMCC14364]|uniref:efflux RND transporter periplasmic adaptor subunit n=1 Tax=Parvularcula sp. IMCC14364 TaxID=3067902 RepID=UPI002740F015|nr:efflux RND transporter periplasmic adaptor subunit [Parvularcula sp. IMCC14364]
MFSKIPSSVRTSLVLTLIVIMYFVVRTLFSSAPEPADERFEFPVTRVVVETINAGDQAQTVVIRGRTKATRSAVLRAETAGQVSATPAREGSIVKRGDELCRITPGTRNAGLAEARAALDKAQIDYNAAVELAQQGYSSEAAVAAARAALDLSQANLTRARMDFAKTKITAPFDGILVERHVEVGDLLTIGASCAKVSQLDPIIITGSVSEQEVRRLSLGATARVTVSGGDELDAVVRLISPAASNMTRTFTVELEAANPNALPDGLTANAQVNLGNKPAHLVPRNALLQDDSGALGVRVVENISTTDGHGKVRFAPVSILNDVPEGVWVAGLDGSIDLIVRGQDYVKHGQEVQTAAPGDIVTTG